MCLGGCIRFWVEHAPPWPAVNKFEWSQPNQKYYRAQLNATLLNPAIVPELSNLSNLFLLRLSGNKMMIWHWAAWCILNLFEPQIHFKYWCQLLSQRHQEVLTKSYKATLAHITVKHDKTKAKNQGQGAFFSWVVLNVERPCFFLPVFDMFRILIAILATQSTHQSILVKSMAWSRTEFIPHQIDCSTACGLQFQLNWNTASYDHGPKWSWLKPSQNIAKHSFARAATRKRQVSTLPHSHRGYYAACKK